MVCTSSDGSRMGNPATSRPGAASGTPPRTRQTSVDVPPMSKVTQSANPLAVATAAAAAHAAGRTREQQRGRQLGGHVDREEPTGRRQHEHLVGETGERR